MSLVCFASTFASSLGRAALKRCTANNFAVYIIVSFADRTASPLFCRVEPQMDVFMCVIRRSRSRAAASSEIYICISRMFAHFSFIENAFSSFARRAIEPTVEAPAAAARLLWIRNCTRSAIVLLSRSVLRECRPRRPSLSLARRPNAKRKFDVSGDGERIIFYLFICRFFPPDSREKRQRAAADRSPNSEN